VVEQRQSTGIVIGCSGLADEPTEPVQVHCHQVNRQHIAARRPRDTDLISSGQRTT
jgi:hypothetical protein